MVGDGRLGVGESTCPPHPHFFGTKGDEVGSEAKNLLLRQYNDWGLTNCIFRILSTFSIKFVQSYKCSIEKQVTSFWVKVHIVIVLYEFSTECSG